MRMRRISARIVDLMCDLYSWTESAMKYLRGVSCYFPLNSSVRQGCLFAPTFFNTCVDKVLGRVVDQCRCGASTSNTKVIDIVFANDALLLTKSLGVLVPALESLLRVTRILGLQISWTKTRVQKFGGLLDYTDHACGEDIKVLESFTYLDSVVHDSVWACQEVFRRIGIVHEFMDSLN
ncbi:uncharacterized protein LOC143024540 [Oratosquilla oratoria]|uniref:uncharacterized protein LOC143024540 n=1 Tax=Oratosquilla oratoria TaxID=337810 RepID=UPI003F774A28